MLITTPVSFFIGQQGLFAGLTDSETLGAQRVLQRGIGAIYFLGFDWRGLARELLACIFVCSMRPVLSDL